MKLIIDSGSTKADWSFINGNVISLNSDGMNPCFINEEKIVGIIRSTLTKEINPTSVTDIYFYGAGCAEKEQKAVIQKSFSTIFPNAKINVDIDTMAAVRATCGDAPGIACIIGTGSNSLMFDGKNPLHNNYGLGYVLADEGAGTFLGKKLITHYLYGILPKDLEETFQKKYSLTREEAITNCYNKPNPNAWLASYARFYAENISHAWIRNTIAEGFDEFLHLYVKNYPSFEKYQTHFIGSIAFLFKDILKDVAITCNVSVGKILQKPMDGLVQYHSG